MEEPTHYEEFDLSCFDIRLVWSKDGKSGKLLAKAELISFWKGEAKIREKAAEAVKESELPKIEAKGGFPRSLL